MKPEDIERLLKRVAYSNRKGRSAVRRLRKTVNANACWSGWWIVKHAKFGPKTVVWFDPVTQSVRARTPCISDVVSL